MVNILLKKPVKSDIPVICIGNLVVGGAGKTPVALKIGKILIMAGYNPHFLTRGYAGKLKDNIKVSDYHSAEEVGDESLILSKIAPTWIGSNRIKSSFFAKKNNADCVIMDDGFQNPTIKKDFSIIVIDNNGYLLEIWYATDRPTMPAPIIQISVVMWLMSLEIYQYFCYLGFCTLLLSEKVWIISQECWG